MIVPGPSLDFGPVPMGQEKTLTFTITNEGTEPVGSFYFYVDYEQHDTIDNECLRFHAQWRRENPTVGEAGDLTAQGINYWTLMDRPNTDGKGNYVILEAEGAGHFVHQERPDQVTAEIVRFAT